jgi:hypothetical protein
MASVPSSSVCVLHRFPDRMKLIVGMIMVATLAVNSGCAKTDWIDRTLVTVDVTGTWLGRVAGTGTGGLPPDFLLELEQQGSTVKGIMRFPAGGTSPGVSYQSRIAPGPVDGTVAGDLFRFRVTNGSVEGELTVSGDEMDGQVSWSGRRPVTLRRVDSSSPPASPPR